MPMGYFRWQRQNLNLGFIIISQLKEALGGGKGAQASTQLLCLLPSVSPTKDSRRAKLILFQSYPAFKELSEAYTTLAPPPSVC